MLPIGLIKHVSEAVSMFFENVDYEILRTKFYDGGFKGRLEIENAEILFLVREKKEDHE